MVSVFSSLIHSGYSSSAEVMNISEGTVVAAPKVGRPRKSLVVAPGGTISSVP